MGRRPRVADVSGAMRHEALTYGRAAAARHAGDGVGAAEEGRAASRRGATPPPACGALWKMAQLGKRARATPRQPAGGCAGARRPRPAGPTARKGAVWAEGLADGTPRARPGHHQAASCGLRRCRELRVRSPARVPLSKGSMGIPSSCLAARQQDIGCSEC